MLHFLEKEYRVKEEWWNKLIYFIIYKWKWKLLKTTRKDGAIYSDIACRRGRRRKSSISTRPDCSAESSTTGRSWPPETILTDLRCLRNKLQATVGLDILKSNIIGWRMWFRTKLSNEPSKCLANSPNQFTLTFSRSFKIRILRALHY